MREKSFDDLVRWAGEGAPFVRCRFCVRWSPTVDLVHLLDSPWALMQAGKHHHVPLLTGVNGDEGSMFTNIPNATWFNETTISASVRKGCFLHEGLPFSLQTELSLIEELTLEYNILLIPTLLRLYPPSIKPPLPPFWWAGSSIYADRDFVCPAQRASLQWAREGVIPVYLYHFQHKPPPCPVCYHSAEIRYVFGVPCPTTGPKPKYACVEVGHDPVGWELSQAMTRYWVQFGKTGDPNPPTQDTAGGTAVGKAQLPHWPAARHGGVVGSELVFAAQGGRGKASITLGGFIRGRSACDFWQPLLTNGYGWPALAWDVSC